MSEQIPTYHQLVDRAINREEFDAAWREIGEAGLGSIEAAEKLATLILDSDWHVERLMEHANDILRDAATWADGPCTKESIRDFDSKIGNKLVRVAAAYAVMGVMVGVLSVCPDEEDS